jgi:hypothetical protein
MTREQHGAAFVIRDLEITPVERISIRSHRVGGSILFEASKRPVAIVVRGGGREWRIEVPVPRSSGPETVYFDPTQEGSP